ncbi:unnamed protein product [Rangifer tarandus platyrhynchus]|uniref:Uncharacterized protein n=1 Tax=Rangifer tarandus platyrhynchus TaxID=3082113 RepID=A0ABN8Y0F4_RANTA|nr:unnamed protein product [Rangifer tarandus platyrhynchus]
MGKRCLLKLAAMISKIIQKLADGLAPSKHSIKRFFFIMIVNFCGSRSRHGSASFPVTSKHEAETSSLGLHRTDAFFKQGHSGRPIPHILGRKAPSPSSRLPMILEATFTFLNWEANSERT